MLLTLLSYLVNTTTTKEKPGYDSRVPPEYEKDVPTNVTLKIFLLSFDSVSETTMDYSMEVYLTMYWLDERLVFQNLSTSRWLEVDTKMMDKIWVPDVYFRNEKEASFHEVTVPNKYMHLYPNGTVIYSMRLSLTLSCRMDLAKYPLDSQKCPMFIQSYTYTTENVLFNWYSFNPIQFDMDMELGQELPQFIIGSNQNSCCLNKLNLYTIKILCIIIVSSFAVHFACIKAYFYLMRDIRYYIIQVYVPSVLIVTLSWVSFWLDLDAIPARVSLGVLTVLTLNTHGSNVQSSLPKVSYIKAIDVWTVTCLLFVFAALLEFAYVNVLARRGQKVGKQMLKFNCLCAKVKQSTDNTELDYINRARRVDKISRLAFPGVFLAFNIAYWFGYIYS
ncbi:glycine receptor subunit alpha-2-like [Gigantopelta aegis]|uniref:glycine receptor subunit alpha-2-like n=1 Tax=Gigantopelta aegis TaxID=1735272 RepID=UPI001B88B0E2|nr:glycine receptor subunit alpha-2-like [Gigantopelta aegis]